MARALERWEQVRSYECPAGWVYRVGLNWATSWLRKLARRPTRSAQDLDESTVDRLPDVDLREQLLALRPEHRSALVLRFYLQFTPTEIANTLEIPVNTAKSHVHRGIRQLRAQSKVTR